MNKVYTIILVVCAYSATAQSTLIHYWNFNNSDTSLWRIPTSSIVKGATLSYQGAYCDYYSDSPDTVNSRDETGVAPFMSLRVRSPYGPFIMTLPTTGYQGIVIKYGAFRSTSGSAFNTVTYTTDGVKWDSVGLVITDGYADPTTGLGTYEVISTGTPLDLIVLDFSSIPGVNNNPKFQVKITFDKSAKGNDRYDNLSVEGTPIAVPVLLNSFKGSVVNGIAKLNWTVTNEINLNDYELQRSYDNKLFTTVSAIVAKNSASLIAYSTSDVITNASQFYRLKIVDKNGKATYSKIVVLTNKESETMLSTFPNPATNGITVSHVTATSGASVQILNIAGKIVYTTQVKTTATQTTIDVSGLAKGIYTVSYLNNGTITSTTFVK